MRPRSRSGGRSSRTPTSRGSDARGRSRDRRHWTFFGRRQMKTTWHFDRTRRAFLRKAGIATALGPLLVTERTIAQTRTLYVNSWGGSYTAAQDAAFFKPFTAATGIQIKTITPVSYGKIKAQVQTKSYEF